MTPAKPAAQPTKTMNLMAVIGVVLLVSVALYYAFVSVDAMRLGTQTGVARVTGKEHRPVAQTYTREIIGGQMRTVPHVTPEMFVLELDLMGEGTTGLTDRDLYESIKVGDQVHVTYQRRRLTRSLQVVSVRR